MPRLNNNELTRQLWTSPQYFKLLMFISVNILLF